MEYGAGGWEIAYERRRALARARHEILKTQGFRRHKLKTFAEAQFKRPNRCQALVNIVQRAADLLDGFGRAHLLAAAMVGDLESVLIGQNMEQGRGSGPHFAGNVFGSKGFRREFQDEYNQVQHATAGLVIGFRYGTIGEWFARWRESEAQDDRLYRATCPLGRRLRLTPKSYERLAHRLRDAIGDPSCFPPR